MSGVPELYDWSTEDEIDREANLLDRAVYWALIIGAIALLLILTMW